MKQPNTIQPMEHLDRAVFQDGQHGTITNVLTSKEGPMYSFRSDAGATFTVKHCEVRKERK